MHKLRILVLCVCILLAQNLLAQPANDDCSNATVVPVGTSCSSQNLSTASTTSEDLSVAPNPTCGAYPGSDVWFTFEVPASGDFRVGIEGVSDDWALYTGSCGGFTQIHCDNGGRNFSDPSLAGQTLYLRVWRFNNAAGGDFTLCIFETDVPENDLCANAIALPVGTSCTYVDYTSEFSVSEGASVSFNPTCGAFVDGDVWFTFEVPASGDFRVDLDGVSDDWEMYTGTCGNFSLVHCDNGGRNFSDPSLGGQTVYLRVWRFNNRDGGDFSVCIFETDVPENDLCANAIPLPVGTSCEPLDYTSAFSVSEGLLMASNPGCGAFVAGDVWFTFQVPASGDFRIELDGISDDWAIYSGSCGSFTQVHCDNGGRNFSDPSLGGQSLYLRVWRFNNRDGGDFSVCIFETDVPVNDLCANAIPLTVGATCTPEDYTTSYSVSEDLSVASNPTCGAYSTGDVWFTFDVPASGDFRVDLDGVSDDWALYSGSCGSFTQVHCDDGGRNFSDPSLGGESLYLRVWRFNNRDGGDFSVCIFETDVPVNDLCANAIQLSLGATCTAEDYTTSYSVSEDLSVVSNPTCGAYSTGDVWFTFDVPASGDFRVDLDGVSDDWALYSGSCGSFTELHCDNGGRNFSDPSLGGESLYLRVWRFNNRDGGDFSVCIWEIDVPVNDLCANAIELELGTSCNPMGYSTSYTVTEDITVAPTPTCGAFSGGDVWFTFQAPASGDFRIELSGNSDDWVLYSGSCGSFTQVACENAAVNYSDPGMGGEIFYLRVWRFNNRDGGNFDICVFETTVPENDLCANALEIAVGETCSPGDFTTHNSTAESEAIAIDPTCGAYSGGDIWFSFEVPVSGQFILDRLSNTNGGAAQFVFYTGQCGNFTEVHCDSGPTVNFDQPALGGETLYLRVFSFNSDQGSNFSFCIREAGTDCNGDFGGSAYLDNCDDCVGGETGEEACEADCNGDFGGTAYLDNCDDCVGGETGEEACEADCNGDYGGSAFLDNCDDCVGGLTGEVACVADCNGDFGGTAYLDNCDDCVGGETGAEACVADCNGDYGGSAFLDNCNECVGGETGDESCESDCNGDFGGTAFLDNCGDCVGGLTGDNACEADCNGDFGGTAFLDNCDDCVGGLTGDDACEADCNGDFGGTAYLDNCDDCVGGLTGEVSCEADCNGDFGGTAYIDNCEDCVGGLTGDDACEADCNGDFGGTAYLDNCSDCVGGETGEVPCEADCNGDFGGSAYLDNCGDCVSGETGEVPCEADCNGDFGGTAYFDNCSDCVGGLTGEVACEADCNGDFGGTAYIDNCDNCVGGLTGDDACEADCNGDFGGTAYFDNCSNCVGGETGEVPCEADCNGDFGGSAYLDDCDDCVGGLTGEVACEADCNGDFGGSAFIDNCGNCVGGLTGEEACVQDCNGDYGGTAIIDNCGICALGNTLVIPCLGDCNGDFDGTAYIDDCGNCVGGNTGELPCDENLCNADGGIISTTDETNFCAGTGQAVEINIDTAPNPDYTSFWMITDDSPDFHILDIFMEQPIGGFVFDSYPGETFYVGIFNAEAPSPILQAVQDDLAIGLNPSVYALEGLCFDVSNPIIVHLTDCDDQPVVDECYAFDVLAYAPGPDKNGQPITDPIRIDPAKALGAPQSDDSYNFVSLGYGGTLVLGFDGVALNGPGNDIVVVETTFGSNSYISYPESGEVLVSQNGIDFFSVGVVYTNESAGFDIDDAGQGFSYITAVMIIDNTPSGSVSDDGIDIDGVIAVHGCGPIPDETPDCAGVVGGTAGIDLCGVCSGGSTGLTPNASCTDCAGILFGSAEIDTCGNCTGGTTGVEPCIEDCAGVFGGTSVLDECDVCRLPDDPDFNSTCTDCAGVVNGSATIDNCGECTGGDTGLEPNAGCGSCYAAVAVAYHEGTTSGGGTIPANRTDPNQALGEPEGTDAMVFLTLGYGGSVILSFDGVVPNGPGDDIEVVETSFGNPGCAVYPEYADVYVAATDTSDFHFLGTVCKSDNMLDIDAAGQGFAYIRHIKIVNNNTLTNTPDGFDLDGVVALHNCEDEIGTSLTTVEPDIANVELSSAPNPTSGHSVVVFTNPDSERVLLEVYDLSGRYVATLFNQVAQEDQEYRLDFDGAYLPNGVYIYRLQTEQSVVIEKFLISR